MILSLGKVCKVGGIVKLNVINCGKIGKVVF